VTGEVRRLAAGVFGFLAPGFGALVDFDALAGFDVFCLEHHPRLQGLEWQ